MDRLHHGAMLKENRRRHPFSDRLLHPAAALAEQDLHQGWLQVTVQRWHRGDAVGRPWGGTGGAAAPGPGVQGGSSYCMWQGSWAALAPPLEQARCSFSRAVQSLGRRRRKGCVSCLSWAHLLVILGLFSIFLRKMRSWVKKLPVG
jgi:hypothetical protein